MSRRRRGKSRMTVYNNFQKGIFVSGDEDEHRTNKNKRRYLKKNIKRKEEIAWKQENKEYL